MTDINNFGIAGVGPIIRLGKNGPQIKNNAGVIEARDPTDSSLAIVRGADGIGPTDFVTYQQLTTSSTSATLSDVTGGQTQLDTTPYAVSLLLTTLKSDAIDSLNHVLGKLVPTAPSNFPGGQSLTVTSVGSNAFLSAGSIPDNTNGGTIPVSAGSAVSTATSARITTATASSNVIGDNGTTGFVGPGDSGTVTALVNNASAGSHLMVTGSDNGTYGNLVISNDTAYPASTPGFYESFRAQISGAAVTQGWNRLKISHSAASSTADFYVLRDNNTSAPTIAGSITLTENGSPTYALSSGINHYGNTTATLNAGSITFANLAGETYYNGNPISFSSSNGITTTQVKTYTNIGISTPITRQTLSAQTLSTQTIQVDGSNVHNSGALTVTGTNVNGSSSAVPVTSTIILVKRGSASGRIDESNTPAPSSSTNVGRIYLGASATTDTPSVTLITGSPNWNSSQDLSASGYTHEAPIVAGALGRNSINYSTGYLPVGIDYSNRTTNTYATFTFSKAALSNFTITVTGTYTGIWIGLPGISDNNSSSPQALGGRWWSAQSLYNGAGIPGRGGDTSAGCASGSVASGTSGTVNITFGTASSTSATGNTIIVRFKFTGTQSITGLTFS